MLAMPLIPDFLGGWPKQSCSLPLTGFLHKAKGPGTREVRYLQNGKGRTERDGRARTEIIKQMLQTAVL